MSKDAVPRISRGLVTYSADNHPLLSALVTPFPSLCQFISRFVLISRPLFAHGQTFHHTDHSFIVQFVVLIHSSLSRKLVS